MIFDTIIIDNFGVYGGPQVADLTPARENRPVILFGGLNGGGKTTFLDAVQLALYGPKARISNRGKLSYREYLRTAIHRNADPSEGASITIQFRRVVDGQMHSYCLLRAWREGVRGIEETVEVLRDGEFDPILSEHWDEYIESYIPSGIAHLFFFDAEQIKELAEGEHAAELLGTAIHSLLGLDIVDRLETDLATLERRKKTAKKSGTEAAQLKYAEEEVARLDQMLQEAVNEKARLVNETDQLSKTVAECEKTFRKEGGELFERRKELEADLARAQKELSTEEHALRELAAGAAPLLLIGPLLEEVEEQARREAEVQKTQVLVDALEERDAAVLKQLRQSQLPGDHLKRLDSVLKQDREARRGLLSTPCFLHPPEHFITELRHLRATVLPNASSQISEKWKSAATFRERVTRAEMTLDRVPDQDAIARLQRDLETLRIRLQTKKGEVDATEAKIQVLQRQKQTADDALDRAHEKHTDDLFGREVVDRVLKHSAKVRGTLGKFREAIIRKHTARIERLMLEAFTQLLRKSNLVTDLKINPENFHIELTGGDGRPLPFDRLSAGERQLLATSLLWGLARASGRPLPTIIDTPLGRLDSSHRRHLIDRYFPVASHQVILLSTDEEIDEESLKRLQRYIGRSYQLQFDETLRATRIEEGYFWKHEATR